MATRISHEPKRRGRPWIARWPTPHHSGKIGNPLVMSALVDSDWRQTWTS